MGTIEERDITDLVRADHRIPDGVTVTAELVADDVDPDLSVYDEVELAAFGRGDWEHVGIVVKVCYDGAVLAVDSLWSVQHGVCPGRWDADAWDYEPTVTADGVIGCGSSLWCVADSAVIEAREMCAKVADLRWGE